MDDTKSQPDDVEDEPVEDEKGEPQAGLESYPLDTLLIRSEPRAIADVLRRIEKRAIQLDPDFERDFIWDEVRQSRLIESVLMRIPLPVFYLAEEKNGLIVVDGLQRLTTFKRFHSGELTLTVEENEELDGKTFTQLSQKLQDRFEDGPLMFYLIDAAVPDRVRLDIFDRVNSGVPLSRQQMRNALYNGPATRVLRELANSDEFLNATGNSLSNAKRRKAMGDREAVNRFLAYYSQGWEKYGSGEKMLGEFDDFLAAALRSLNDNSNKLKQAKGAFLQSMQMNFRVFGKHAFRKHSSVEQPRNSLNLALFDVFSVGLGRYKPSRVTSGKEAKLRDGFYRLLDKQEFLNAVSYATARAENVHTRFRLGEEMLVRVLGAH